MFNVAVIRLRDLVKYLFVITAIIVIIIFAKRYINKKSLRSINLGQKVSANIGEYAKKAIDVEMPEIKQIQASNEKEDTLKWYDTLKINLFNKMLELQLSAINLKQDEIIQVANAEINNEHEENKDTEKDENIELAKTDVKTEIVTKNPLADTYNKKYKGVKIRNETNFDLTDESLNYDHLKIDKSNIIIFHTHTCESYTSSEKYTYTPTGKYRTTNLKYSVARVGDELTKYLNKYNINVVHDKTYHDYPAYSGSYSRSLATVKKILKNTKADIIIDLHRDAIGSNSSYAPTVKIGDEYCAQLMFVMGSNGGGLNHPNWQNNLRFAVKMQEKANKLYPGLFKPIILRNSRYNQHLSKAACIIEVGSTGNTLDQCLNSMKYLAKVVNGDVSN